MDEYQSKMIAFLQSAETLGKSIHEDTKKASKIFEELQKGVSFASIIEQRASEGDKLLDECKSFARCAYDWSSKYPELLKEFHMVLKIVILELNEMRGVHVEYDSNRAKITFNEQEFRFEMGKQGTFQISQADLGRFIKKENKIVQELAEVLTLDIRLGRIMDDIERLTREHSVSTFSRLAMSMSNVSDPELVHSMHQLSLWWLEVIKRLEVVKKLTITAIKMDSKVQKQMRQLFEQDKNQRIKENSILIAKTGIVILSKITFALVPGLGLVQGILDVISVAKLTKDTVKTLKS